MPGPYEYTVSEEERCQAHTWWRTQLLADGRPVVVLHPGANWPHKRWALERFAALGERLMASRLWQVVLTGGPDDRLLAQRIAHTMREAPLVLAGQTTVRELAAGLERVRLLISNDTGILHIAAALGRPVVGLYGPTSPSFTGPLGDPSRTVVIHHVGSCPQIPCYQPDHPEYPGMDAISVDEVYQATLTLLQRYV
jgi:lipopolysaccharide heptosyltransferase II